MNKVRCGVILTAKDGGATFSTINPILKACDRTSPFTVSGHQWTAWVMEGHKNAPTEVFRNGKLRLFL